MVKKSMWMTACGLLATSLLLSAQHGMADEAPHLNERKKIQGPALCATGTRALDGDSMLVETTDGKTLRVHLYGVRAPYKNQPLGRDAHKYLEELVLGKDLVIEPKYEGPQHSLYAEVSAPEAASVALALAEAGYGWFDMEMAPEYHALEQAMRKARDEDRGVWGLPNPVSPKEHRRSNLALTAGQ